LKLIQKDIAALAGGGGGCYLAELGAGAGSFGRGSPDLASRALARARRSASGYERMLTAVVCRIMIVIKRIRCCIKLLFYCF